MKNVIAFFCGVALLFALPFLSNNNFNLENYEKVVLVAETEIDGCQSIQNGNDFYSTFTDKTWQKHSLSSKAVIFYFNDFDFSSFAKSCDEIYRCEDIDGNSVYEGFYKDYLKSCFVNGKKVNFQLAIKGKTAILGFPMIVVGF